MAEIEIRCYLIIDASAPRTDAQWGALKGAVRDKPMLAYFRSLCQTHDLPQCQVLSRRNSLDNRYAMVRFVIMNSDKTAAVAQLNSLAAQYGVTGNAQQKFVGVIQFELRQAATDLGYTLTQANNLTCSIIGYDANDYQAAIAQASAYIATNAANWEPVVS